MNNKYITLNYTEYLKLLEDIEILERIISDMYRKADKEQQLEINRYMVEHEKWI